MVDMSFLVALVLCYTAIAVSLLYVWLRAQDQLIVLKRELAELEHDASGLLTSIDDMKMTLKRQNLLLESYHSGWNRTRGREALARAGDTGTFPIVPPHMQSARARFMQTPETFHRGMATHHIEPIDVFSLLETRPEIRKCLATNHRK